MIGFTECRACLSCNGEQQLSGTAVEGLETENRDSSSKLLVAVTKAGPAGWPAATTKMKAHEHGARKKKELAADLAVRAFVHHVPAAGGTYEL